jgi:hypothetical protein
MMGLRLTCLVIGLVILYPPVRRIVFQGGIGVSRQCACVVRFGNRFGGICWVIALLPNF